MGQIRLTTLLGKPIIIHSPCAECSKKLKKQELLDIDSDYLISAFGQTTGTGLAGLLGNSVSHDQGLRTTEDTNLDAETTTTA